MRGGHDHGKNLKNWLTCTECGERVEPLYAQRTVNGNRRFVRVGVVCPKCGAVIDGAPREQRPTGDLVLPDGTHIPKAAALSEEALYNFLCKVQSDRNRKEREEFERKRREEKEKAELERVLKFARGRGWKEGDPIYMNDHTGPTYWGSLGDPTLIVENEKGEAFADGNWAIQYICNEGSDRIYWNWRNYYYYAAHTDGTFTTIHYDSPDDIPAPWIEAMVAKGVELPWHEVPDPAEKPKKSKKPKKVERVCTDCPERETCWTHKEGAEGCTDNPELQDAFKKTFKGVFGGKPRKK